VLRAGTVLLLLVKVRMAILSQAEGPAKLESSSDSGQSLIHKQELNSYYILPAATSMQFSNFLSLIFFCLTVVDGLFPMNFSNRFLKACRFLASMVSCSTNSGELCIV